MAGLPETSIVPVIRADFSDDDLWTRLGEEIQSETEEGFLAVVELVEDRSLVGLDDAGLVGALLRANPDEREYPVVFVVDSKTISSAEHPLLVIDLHVEDETSPFRCLPRQVQAVENNLSLANLDFADFADYANSGDGVFRGF